jgi:hypothetical protein
MPAKFARRDTVWCLKKGAVGLKGSTIKVISDDRSWQYQVEFENRSILTASSNSFTKNEGDVARKRKQFDDKTRVRPRAGKWQRAKNAYRESDDGNSDDNR